MKVLIVSEGKHEQSGALETLVKRLGGDEATYEHNKVSDARIHAFHGEGDGYFKRAVRWLHEAEKRGFDGLVMVIDEDGDRPRATQITRAQDFAELSLRRAIGVAIRTFDAWMLADEQTLTSVQGCVVNQLPAPETIRSPKERCANLLEDSENRMSQSEMYAKIAERVDLDLLAQRCPCGFGVFSARVRAVFA